jgi:hypothetical protein
MIFIVDMKHKNKFFNKRQQEFNERIDCLSEYARNYKTIDVDIIEERTNFFILMEKEGVSMYSFKKEIDPIVFYIKSYIQRNNVPMEGNYNNGYFYKLGKYEKNPFPNWIKNFELSFKNCCCHNEEIAKKKCGNSSYDNINYNQISDNKLEKAVFNIECTSIGGILIEETLRGPLYHEFNHAYQNYQMLLKNPNYSITDLNKNYNYSGFSDMLDNDPDDNHKYFAWVMYWLFMPAERNAHTEQLYGELQGLKATSFDDLYDTRVYRDYYTIKNAYIPTLLKLNDEYWEFFGQYLHYGKNIKDIKDNFKKYSQYFLDIMIRKIGKCVSLYFEKENIMNEHFCRMERFGSPFGYNKFEKLYEMEKIVPRIIPKINEADFEYLDKDGGNYKSSPDSEIATQEPVGDDMSDTKSITGDEFANDQTRNNYWWSKVYGSGMMNCNAILTTKGQLKETVEKYFDNGPEFFYK